MSRLLFCFSVLTAASPARAATDQTEKIAILDVQTSTGIDVSLAPVLTEVLTTEVHSLKLCEVISGSDIRALLGFQREQDLLGCDDTGCMAELGGALGVQRILVATVGRIEDTHVLSLKLIDLSGKRPTQRVYESVRGDIKVVLQTMRNSVRKLFGLEPLPTAAAAGPAATRAAAAGASAAPATFASPAALAPPASSTSIPLGALLLFGMSAAGAGAGIYCGLDAKAHHDKSVDPKQVGRQAEIAPGERSQIYANLAFTGAALSAVGGLVWWLFGSRDSSGSGRASAPPIQVTVVPAPGNGVSGGFTATVPFGR